ncbi:MAG TPA: FUSC family protein [Caulobacteraceae bacterium]|jgi:uncharacterized membrane protein YccC|nr:FUSC family protein [Caulobacteraceae bacterium]
MALESVSAWATRRRPQLRLALRITLASLATFAVGRLLGLAQAYWAVLTAVIVTQASIGGSLKASRDRFIGSLGGAAWGVAVSLSLPHTGIWWLAAALTVAVGPLAVITAINPAYRIASVTAIIILLTPTSQSAGPLAAAISRLLEIGLGSVIALAVTLTVLPERAHGIVSRAAAMALEAMSALSTLLSADPRDETAVANLHQKVRKAIITAEAAADEAARERQVSLSGPADPEPLCRTLRRLHNDLIMIGRASQARLGAPVGPLLAGPATDATAAIARWLSSVGQAVAARRGAPGLDEIEQAMTGYATAVADLRRGGLTRDLPDDAVGRIFGLSFALEQLASHLRDLAERTDELAGSPSP